MTGGGDRSLKGADRIAAQIASLHPLSPRILRVTLHPTQWRGWRAGQHVNLRLTAADGHQAHRSYSLLWTSEPDVCHLAIERVDGKVSEHFHNVAQPGDQVEILGPIGGRFVWEESEPRPALLVAGGSGVVPLLSMAAARFGAGVTMPMALVIAARRIEDVAFGDEIRRWEAEPGGFKSYLALSRDGQAPRPQGRSGRIDAGFLSSAPFGFGCPLGNVLCYVCGRNAFVESITSMLERLSVAAGSLRTERFGG